LATDRFVARVCSARVAVVASVVRAALTDIIHALIVDRTGVVVIAGPRHGNIGAVEAVITGVVRTWVVVIAQVQRTGATRVLNQGVVASKHGIAEVFCAGRIIVTPQRVAGFANAVYAQVIRRAGVAVLAWAFEWDMGAAQVREAGVGRAGVLIVAGFRRGLTDATTAHRRGRAWVAVVAGATGRGVDASLQRITTVRCAVVAVIAGGFKTLAAVAFLAVIRKCAGVAVFAGGVIGLGAPSQCVEIGVTPFACVQRIGVSLGTAFVKDQTFSCLNREEAATDTVAFIQGARAVVVACVLRSTAYASVALVVVCAVVFIVAGEPDDARRWSSVFALAVAGVRIRRVAGVCCDGRVLWTGCVGAGVPGR